MSDYYKTVNAGMRLILVCVLLFCVYPSYAKNITMFQFSVGEKDDYVFLRPRYECGEDINMIAEKICAANTSHGGKAKNFSVSMIHSEGGNKCGYSIFRVVCTDFR